MFTDRIRLRFCSTMLRRISIAVFVTTVAFGPVQPAAAQVFFNELHYDNAGTDVGEAIEIAGPAGTDLTGWSIAHYNGNGGAVYRTTGLSGTIAIQHGGLGTVCVTLATNSW